MGVSLYCLKYGSIPFNRDGVMDMYDAIRSDEPSLPQDENPAFVDLMQKVLNKDPEQRITMDKLRVRQSNLSSTCIVDANIQTGTSLGHQGRHG